MMSLTFGRGAFGDPLTEWGYITPATPEGVTGSELKRSDVSVQAAVVDYWFRLNWEPYNADGPWFTLEVSILDGPDLLAPDHYSPDHILNDEFSGLLSPDLTSKLATTLAMESVEWAPVPPDAGAENARDITSEAVFALERVNADVETATIGHNQGPPLNPELKAAIRDAVAEGLAGVKSGIDGRTKVAAAVAALSGAAGVLGAAFIRGLAKEAGREAYPHAKQLLVSLYYHLGQAVDALGHWLASLPPLPPGLP